MAFSVHDMIAVVCGDGNRTQVTEAADARMESLEFNNIPQLQKMFPDEEFSSTKSVAYMASVLCNSFPKRNHRGRMMMPKVLSRSVASARDSILNIDHTPFGVDGEGIVGHVKTASFQWNEDKDGLRPDVAIPVHALNALSLRHPRIQKILEDQASGAAPRKWATSMECKHNLHQCGFWYENEYIPVQDAEEAMRMCVGKMHVKDYKGKQLSLCIGGEDGIVDFWGYALTQDPADTDATILGFASHGREAASAGNKKKVFFGLSAFSLDVRGKTAEEAASAVDTQLTELASVEVLGQTEAAPDGHTHDVLSDGTIFPANGHTHYLPTWVIKRGTNPRFTGHTDQHTIYQPGPEYVGGGISHMHLIDINLRGKSGANANDEPVSTESASISSEEFMNLKAMLARVEAAITKVSTGKVGTEEANKGGGNPEILAELNAIKSELASGDVADTIKQAVASEVANLTASGDLVAKDEVQKKVDEAVAKAKADAEAAAEEQKLRQARLDKITALGVNVDSPPFGEPETAPTIRSRIDAIGIGGVNDELFSLHFDKIQLLHAAATKEAAVGAEAANKGKAEPAKKAPPPFLIGAGVPAATEVANTGKPGVGRNAIAKR